jgi:hypothetical protein
MMVIKPSITQIHYLSSLFYNSSIILSKKCKEIELINEHDITAELIAEHAAFFYGSIFNAVSSLEAHINELYFKISEFADSASEIDTIPKNKSQIIKRLWNLKIPRTASYPILDKYKILLALCEKEEFNEGISTYQNATFLIKLRNALIHYEPELIELQNPDRNIKIHGLESALTGKFSLNPFSTTSDSFYPKRIISAGCCEWAIQTVNRFIKEFAEKFA